MGKHTNCQHSSGCTQTAVLAGGGKCVCKLGGSPGEAIAMRQLTVRHGELMRHSRFAVATDSLPHHGPPDLRAVGFVVRPVAAGADFAWPAHALRAFILRVAWLTLSLAAAVNVFLTLPIAPVGRQSAARCSAAELGTMIARAANTARCGGAGGLRQKSE